MSFGSAVALVSKFASSNGGTAYPNLGITRKVFAGQLMDRLNSNSNLDQQDTSLCGPAVFLYAVLRRDPEAFARYVVDLYEKGEAKIGDLIVKPGADCRSFHPAARGVRPVDWVALASLRDGANYLFDYQSPANEVAGITLPTTLASWFTAAKFSQVENNTNLVFDSDLQTLVKASQRYSSGSAVCLLIGANLLSGAAGGSAFPDHWVALASPITIDGATMPHLAGLGNQVNGDAKLAAAQVRFDVFTWGKPESSRSPAAPRADRRNGHRLFLWFRCGEVA